MFLYHFKKKKAGNLRIFDDGISSRPFQIKTRALSRDGLNGEKEEEERMEKSI